MPSVDQHIVQWRHNRRFARTIEPQFRDWQINVVFYTALHAVDAAIAKIGLRVTDHSERIRVVLENDAFAGVRNAYMNLYRISRVTRYDAEPDHWLPQQYLSVSDLVEDLLRPIELGLAPLLGTLLKCEPLPLKS